MSIGEDLRSWLLDDAAIVAIVGDRIHQNSVPQDTGDVPYIYYSQGGSDRQQDSDLNNPSATPYRVNWDVECISHDIDEALNIADLITARHQYKGAFGNARIAGVFVSSQSDEYVARGINDDEGWNVAALDIQTAGYSA